MNVLDWCLVVLVALYALSGYWQGFIAGAFSTVGLLLGGILGNLTDRLLREPGFLVGHVVDFINTPWMWLGMNPAIYNIADIFIVSMMIAVAVLVLLGRHLDGGREGDAERAAEAADAETASSPAED